MLPSIQKFMNGSDCRVCTIVSGVDLIAGFPESGRNQCAPSR